MAGLVSTGIYGFICSMLPTGKRDEKGKPIMQEHFLSGFAGWGWKIWKTVAGFFRLEIDELVVRRTMTVFELLIQKIRAVKGAMAITQANGKIKSVALSADETFYLIALEEDDMSFVEHDFIRCQEFTASQRFYHVEVAAVSEGVIQVPVSEFEGSSVPMVGDEIVQFGNSSHDEKYEGRHTAIYLHADEGGQPSIDVMFGIYSKDWTGCVKTRVGGDIPGTNGLKGFYCENGMIKGVDSTGHTVYCIYPDGSAMFGDGSAEFNTDRSGHIAGGAFSWKWDATKKKYVVALKDVVLKWENLDDESKENLKGENGKDGTATDGVNGKDGVSMIFKGEHPSHPNNPQNGWYYRNSSDKKSYVYQDNAWYQMTIDGVDGVNGSDGLSVIWKGDLATPPENPEKNWVYRDTHNGRVYLYNGYSWTLMVADGSNGTDGTNGTDGFSVFITYHDSSLEPETPIGTGTTDGWHTAPNSNCTWMSQKVAEDAYSGTWGSPIRIRGNDGTQGVPGEPGEDGKILYTWIRFADDTNGGGISNNPTGKSYIGLSYNQESMIESNTPSDYIWALIKGTDGVQGAPGTDGKSTYTWIAYSDNADGSGMYQLPTASTVYIGIAVNKETPTEGTDHTLYVWSRFKGEAGEITNIPWLSNWNGYATELGDEYIVTPKMFSGTRSADGKLTGIAQGRECYIDKEGNKRTGIFALVDDEVVFELDPMTKRYVFRGRVEATEGAVGGWSITDDGICSEEFSEEHAGVLGKNKTTFKKDGSFGGNLLKLDYSKNGYLTNDIWEYPMLEWEGKLLRAHRIFSIPFEETSAICSGESGPLLYSMHTSNIIIEPSYSIGLGKQQTVYYDDLPTGIEYSGVTFRIFNPPTRRSTWIPNDAVIRCKRTARPTYRDFLGKYTGTELSIPVGKMAVITGVRIWRHYVNSDPKEELAWYVESI